MPITQVVPFCGCTVGGLRTVVLHIVGVAEVHPTSHTRAVLAAPLPMALCWVCVALVTALANWAWLIAHP